MRVCYVAHYAVSLAGAELSLLGLMENIRKFGVEPYLVSDADCPLVRKAEEAGIRTKVIPVKNYTYLKQVVNKRAYMLYPVKRLFNTRFHREMKKFLRDEKIDLVHLNSSVVCHEWAAVARQCKIPYVWHFREFMDRDHNAVTIGKRYFMSLVRNADRRIAISGAVQKYWSKILGRDCDLVYNGLDVDDYYQEHPILDKDLIKCIIVARVVEGKGQLEAVKAMKILVDRGITSYRLILVGFRHMDSNDYEVEIENYIRDNKLEEYVELTDFTSDVRSVHGSSDIGLVCSRAEAFGRITIEYKLAGLLAVGANSGGTPELIENGRDGILYKQGSPESLADRLEWVLANRDKARKLALRGQAAAAQEFTIARTAENVYNIYRQVVTED